MVFQKKLFIHRSLFVAWFALPLACVGSGKVGASDELPGPASAGRGQITAGPAALEVAMPGRVTQYPCRPSSERERSEPKPPQIEVGLKAPSEGQEAMFGDPMPYAAYRCD